MTPPSLLIAEDDPDDLFLIRHTLRALAPDLAVVAVRDGVEMLEWFDDCADTDLPSLAIVDLNMPRMDGREVLRHMQRQPRLQSIPTCVFTTSVEREDRAWVAHLEGVLFLTKPESLADMRAAIERMLESAGLTGGAATA